MLWPMKGRDTGEQWCHHCGIAELIQAQCLRNRAHTGFRPLIIQFACCCVVPRKQWNHLLRHLRVSAKFNLPAFWDLQSSSKGSKVQHSDGISPFFFLLTESRAPENAHGLPRLRATCSQHRSLREFLEQQQLVSAAVCGWQILFMRLLIR